MNSNFLKRFGAYFIDVMLVSFVMSIVSLFLTTENVYKLNEEYMTLNETLLNENMELSVYYNRIADISLSLDKENFLINIINCVIIILYFVVLPLYKNGQTLGKKLFKIKVVREDNEDLNANELILRNVIVNGLLNTFIAFCLVFLLSEFEYFTIVSILGFAQTILIIVSALMIIFRKDKKGLQDIITKTHVINENLEVENERI